jgi:prepilin-type N-terminal cleavage/methylation domain-containing protein
MQKKAFTLIEIIITILLVGIMAAAGYFYFDTSTMNRSKYISILQSQFNVIEAMTFQCKSLSEQMPNQVGGADAADTNLSLLECNTSTPYAINGGRYGFVPIPPTGFTSYTATESGTAFYISTTAENNSTQDEAFKKLILNYTAQQADLNHSATTATFRFYLSR